jgi:hypothetical protein
MRSRNPLIRGVAGQHLVGQRQTLGGHDQGDDDLHTIRPVVAGIAKAALVAFRKRRIRLEVCARQVVEQHVVADVEQIAPPHRQVIEDRLLVDQQPIMAAIQLVDLGKPRILAQEVGERAAEKPLAVQAPLAAWRQQATGDQHEQHPVPARPLAAHAQKPGPENIQLQLPPQHQRQPARSPLPRPAEPQLRQLDPDDRRVCQQPFAAVFGKQRQRPQSCLAAPQNLDRPPPRQLLRTVDLAQIQHVPLHYAAAGDPRVLDNAPVAMLLASFRRSLERENIMAANYRHIRGLENRLGRHYTDFRPQRSLSFNNLPHKNRGTAGRIGKVRLTKIKLRS